MRKVLSIGTGYLSDQSKLKPYIRTSRIKICINDNNYKSILASLAGLFFINEEMFFTMPKLSKRNKRFLENWKNMLDNNY